MNSKDDHLKLIKAKGNYPIDCIREIFSTEEWMFLNKFGYWCEALIDGTLAPTTMKQEQFIRVVKGELEPETIEEEAWLKLMDCRRANSKPGDIEHRDYLPAEDTFYNRDMAKKMKGMMYGVMKNNHREI